MKARQIMTKSFISIQPDNRLLDILDLFLDHDITCLPVISKDVLVGILPLKELLKYLAAGKPDTPVIQVIDKDPLVVHEDSLIDPVVKHFKNVIVVVDNKKKVTGLIRNEELINYFNKQLIKNKALVKELNAVIESSYDGIYIADARGFTTRVNKAYERITGLEEKELVGKNLATLVDEGYYSSSTTLKVMESKKTVTIVQRLKNGKKILCTGNPVFNEDGHLDKVITNVRDITELEELKRKLDQAEELKDRYLTEAIFLRQQQLQLDGLIVRSENMQNVIKQCIKVAEFDSSVLILGESGVGKEIIAKLIHKSSKRSSGPFMKINCGAIPENLLESELFGYEEGAFTGARKNGKPGFFELASGGTLLLDEISELPLQMQVSLLRVIQEKEFIRVGGTKPIKTNVRLLFASNRNLEEMVGNGEFRKDLFYRINVIPIKIPPLRERVEDIRPLIDYFVGKIQTQYGIKKTISEDTMKMMQDYIWPGNVRELENVVERILVLTMDPVIKPEHLPDNISKVISEKNGARDNQPPDLYKNGIIPLKDALDEVEKQLIKQALITYGSTRKAANALRVSQSTIVRRAKELKIN